MSCSCGSQNCEVIPAPCLPRHSAHPGLGRWKTGTPCLTPVDRMGHDVLRDRIAGRFQVRKLLKDSVCLAKHVCRKYEIIGQTSNSEVTMRYSSCHIGQANLPPTLAASGGATLMWKGCSCWRTWVQEYQLMFIYTVFSAFRLWLLGRDHACLPRIFSLDSPAMLFRNIVGLLASGSLITLAAAESAVNKRRVPTSHVVHERQPDAWASQWERKSRLAGDSVLPMRIGIKQNALVAGHQRLMEM
jgi:hypothetical protein